MTNITLKTEWLDLIAMLATSEYSGEILELMHKIKDFVRTGNRLKHDEYYQAGVVCWGVQTWIVYDTIVEDILEQEAEQQKRRAALSEAGKKGAKTKATLSQAKPGLTTLSQEKEETKEKRSKRESKEVREVYASSDMCNINSNISSDACAEPEKSDSAPEAPPIASLLLNDGTEFAVTQDIYDRLARTYPAVDTMQQLREIENWCFSNPKNRKTRNGVMRFINSWFSREQDKGLVPKYRQRNQPQPRLTAEEIYNLPAISPWETGG